MKEKILSTIYKKLSDGFQTHFYTYSEFENAYSKHYFSLLEELTSLTKTYYQLKNSANKDESSEVIKVHKEDFIIQSFNNKQRSYNSQNKYTIENLAELKETKEGDYSSYSKNYDYYFENETNFVTPFLEFIETRAGEIVSAKENENILSIDKIFWNYFLNSFATSNVGSLKRKEELIKTPELILENFRADYLSNIFLQFLHTTDKQISDIEFSGLESYIINIGERKYITERSGWTTNNFQVINSGKTYAFSTSTKDESKIEGKFVNIFILQLNKRHLLKISITVDETEQTPYIIYRDFEKVSLKNECEILIAKHHGNETIIFDSKKEALDFQAKVLELKEGRNNNYRKN